MNILYIDCSMGAAGDMLSGALMDLMTQEERMRFLHTLNDNLHGLAEVSCERSQKNGIAGLHVHVLVNGAEEGANNHEHSHSHHHHEHHSLSDILAIIDGFTFPDDVKQDIREIYRLIAGAESKVHGKPVGEIHFHEVGAMDAVADISAVCYALHLLSPDSIAASPVTTGFGTVRCAHGILPVPAPATAELLKGIPAITGDVEGELCTPTGAALLRHFVSSYGLRPDMILEGTGRGVGTKDFNRPNILQVFKGISPDATGKASESASGTPADFSLKPKDEVKATEGGTPADFSIKPKESGKDAGDESHRDVQEAALTDTVSELSCNIDDMTGEEIGFAAEQLLKSGALDVWTTPIQMKKSRPGVLLTVLCRSEDEPSVVRNIFKYTTTLGIRKSLDERYILERESGTIETAHGPVHKKASHGYGVTRSKYEYEDLARIARETGRSIREVSDTLRFNDGP